ncbi:hypothetical protein RHOSPDRAFT_34636 [Rhodotorula sp. JG-1b]|nr:hypothetical protein RHOSPDRAFT_34636 [Rhodotorula sp. JG-1b]
MLSLFYCALLSDNEIGQEIQKAFDDGVDIALVVPASSNLLTRPDPTPTPYHSPAIAPLVSINCRSHAPSLAFQSRVHCSSGRQALRHAQTEEG